MKKGWLALALAVIVLLLTLAVPVRANANPLDSFNSGFDTLLHPNTEVMVEDGLPEDYEPQEVDLYGTQNVRAFPEDPTVTDYVNNTVDSFNTVNVLGGNRNILSAIRWFLTAGMGRGSIPTVAVLLVFVWWGVRKSKSIIWTAYRTGRLNLGTSVKRAYYKRKAKEWYG